MMHADQHGILLRYEDICAGKLSPEAAERLDAAEPGIAERLTAAFTQQYNQSNPTFSGNRSDWHSIWNPDLDRFFTESGLSEINQALGYV
ncbi:hypothetical protein [Burkholderia multivorans]|nr:hypothetical protein [Burkholderia multivorans]MBU9525266.1 hypothetical protein [Burkholderia multivorans]